MAPGMIFELNAGEDVKIASPGNTASEADATLKTEQRLMASGQGMSYEVVSRDMSQTNYSSARQGLIEDEATFAEEIQMLEEVIMDEVYETFLISCELAGLLPVKNFWDKKQEYMKHIWVASPKPWIDPLKEANANKIALATGQKSFVNICAENGQDWQEQLDDMKKVAEYATSLGIEIGGITYGESQKAQGSGGA
jgi:capsid protein